MPLRFLGAWGRGFHKKGEDVFFFDLTAIEFKMAGKNSVNNPCTMTAVKLYEEQNIHENVELELFGVATVRNNEAGDVNGISFQYGDGAYFLSTREYVYLPITDGEICVSFSDRIAMPHKDYLFPFVTFQGTNFYATMEQFLPDAEMNDMKKALEVLNY